MNRLKTSFRSDSFEFRQLDRTGDVAVFAKRKGELDTSYEVVAVQRVPERVLFGRLVEAHEAMPTSEAWGEKGWAYRDKPSAFRKMRELISRRSTSQCRCIGPRPSSSRRGRRNAPRGAA